MGAKVFVFGGAVEGEQAKEVFVLDTGKVVAECSFLCDVELTPSLCGQML